MDFTSRLMLWYQHHQRALPWRQTSDAYKIWLSEVILQQTRIAQGMSYYHRFLEHFPDVYTLAAASEDQVLALWQGLGYYSRARNMHHTAKIIVEKWGGEFPASCKDLRQLKGVGPYTAAAIASIAFNLPHAAVDGNVIRVIARYLGIEHPVDLPATVKMISEAAEQWIDRQQPGAFNQALMDLGALICKPSGALCQQCPFVMDCQARINNKVDAIPVKKKKIRIKTRYFHFFFIYTRNGEDIFFLVQRRDDKDIWRNLHQIPLLETSGEAIEPLEIIENKFYLHNMLTMSDISVCPDPVHHTSHQLTHQRIEAFFYVIRAKSKHNTDFDKSLRWLTFEQFQQLGKPVLISRFLEKVQKSL